MPQYLLIANDLRPFDGKPLTAVEVYDLMMKHRCWEFTASAPHFRKMQSGDVLVFYLGGPKARYMAGEATIAGKPQPIDDNSPVTFDRSQIPYFTWRVRLRNLRRFVPGSAGLGVLERLSFVKNSTVERKYIGLLLRGGCRPLTPEDLELIRGEAEPG